MFAMLVPPYRMQQAIPRIVNIDGEAPEFAGIKIKQTLPILDDERKDLPDCFLKIFRGSCLIMNMIANDNAP
ncbi:hypothetical protein BB934_00140 [Microvirga ossetica]|uniref:Uncharacterized protein n=1 Tax=Microvirga ossetica TaxID=1882682 RepID=A0A1B2EA24_9HYPH|nr:hypothetical protein BB934_00140 [Microvirga ossetica]